MPLLCRSFARFQYPFLFEGMDDTAGATHSSQAKYCVNFAMGLKMPFTVAQFNNNSEIVQPFLADSSMCAAGLASVPPWDPLGMYAGVMAPSFLLHHWLSICHSLCAEVPIQHLSSTLPFGRTFVKFDHTIWNSLLRTTYVCAFASAKL